MICDHCEQEMLDQVGCTVLQFDGEPARKVWDGERFCHDCYAPPDTQHHPGCAREECPICGGQAISCGCTPAETRDN